MPIGGKAKKIGRECYMEKNIYDRLVRLLFANRQTLYKINPTLTDLFLQKLYTEKTRMIHRPGVDEEFVKKRIEKRLKRIFKMS